MPIFKKFIKNTLYLDQFKEFKVPNGIYFAPINYNTGVQTDFDDKILFLKHLKEKDINNLNNKQLISNYNYDKLIKFRQFLLMNSFQINLNLANKTLKNIRGYL